MNPWARCGAVAAGAIVLALLLTWPLARCLGSCLGPPPDTLLSAYFLAWVAHALTTPGVALLDAPMFAPYANTLALGEYLPAYAPVAIPVMALTGNPVAAHGVVLLTLYVATALGAYALARRLLGAEGPALLAGIAFGFSPRILDTAYNVQSMAIAWVPWLFLALERFVERPTLARGALLLPLALGLALSSMNVFAFTGVVVLVWLGVAAVHGRVGPAHVARLATMAAPGVALLWAYVAPYRRAARDWDLGRTLAEVEGGSATLAHLTEPPPESLLRWALSGGAAASVPVEGVLLGMTLTVLAILGLVTLWRERDPRARALVPYLAVAAVSFVLAFGPTLHTALGAYPLPYRVFHAFVPGFGAVRTPGRFLLYVDLVTALLAGVGAAHLRARMTGPARRVALAGLALLLLAEAVLVPFPGAVPRLDPSALPEAYRWLRGAPPGTVALGIPMADWVNVAASAFHLRRTVNGWASFEPPRYRDLVAAMEAFPDARTVALVRSAGATVVLIDRAWLTPARTARLADPGSGLIPDRLFPTHLVYRVSGPPPPAPETRLRVEARIDGSRACVAVQNPSPDWVPLYPGRRLTLARAETLNGRDAKVAWLPLDLAPGAEQLACLAPGTIEEISGIIEGGSQRFRFAARPGQPPLALETMSP